MNKIDVNALPPVREPDDKDIAGGSESLAGRARASTTSADIDYGDAAPELASRGTEYEGAAGDTAFSVNRAVHHATVSGAAHHARHADLSKAGMSRKELLAALAKPKQFSSIIGVPRRDRRTVAVDPDSPDAQSDAGERGGQTVLAFCPGDMAAIDSISEQVENETGNKSRSGRKNRGNNDHSAGAAEDDGRLTAHERVLSARADRVHYLAMAAMAGALLLRPPAPSAAGTLPALKPQSRAECQRRCGTDGFCDPSDPLGCGGEYCAGRHVGSARD
jgi:hypothetical protein